jgi:hypothetical protein
MTRVKTACSIDDYVGYLNQLAVSPCPSPRLML